MKKTEDDFIDKQLDDDANGVKCPRTMSFKLVLISYLLNIKRKTVY